ncbi:MAG: cytochrome c biogenesis protein CcdA, partial [Bacteroidota bacterium]
MNLSILLRKSFFVLLFTATAIISHAQILTPVKWETSYKHVEGNTFDLVLTAVMDDGWAIYSQFTEEGGPVPTSFIFKEGSHYSKEGNVKEKGKLKEGMDKLFGVNVKKFPRGPVVFTQRVKVNDFGKAISGELEFMTCDDKRCLPPTVEEFTFNIEPVGEGTGAIEETSEKKTIEEATASTNKSEQLEQVSTPVAKKEKKPKQVRPEPKPVNDEPERTHPVAKTKSKKVATPSSENDIDVIPDVDVLLPQATGSFAEESTESFISPVDWDIELYPEVNGVQELKMIAKMDKGWTIYSQHTSDDGPVPTYFEFEKGSHFELDGEMIEKGNLKQGPDPLFGGVVVKKFVKDPVTFTQKIKINDPQKDIKGFVEFMSCDDKKCLPPTPVFFSINKSTGKIIASANEIEDEANAASTPVVAGSAEDIYNLAAVDVDNPIGICGKAPEEESKSLWSIFILGFLGGLLALLTPCVFPMIPLTVSFFTKGAGKSRSKGLTDAAMYGFFIFFVYLLLSLPFHLLDSVNPDILNNISTNVWLNLFFFAIFVFFAFSFFGYYELSLPSSLSNKVSQAEGIGGMIGIFFMALTLALVSFSCTGPILGSLLAGALSSDGGAMQLTSGMGGFGLALALPFAVFAAFPSLMKSLPKSGGWMTTFKVVLGFAELALAFKFLSNADLVKHWGLLKIEPYLIIWILIGIATVLYLLGYIRFPHDSKIKKLHPARLGLAALFGAFTIYLMTGFRYDDKAQTFKPLTLLSGIDRRDTSE